MDSADVRLLGLGWQGFLFRGLRGLRNIPDNIVRLVYGFGVFSDWVVDSVAGDGGAM